MHKFAYFLVAVLLLALLIIFLLLESSRQDQKPTVAIDQPEKHLRPSTLQWQEGCAKHFDFQYSLELIPKQQRVVVSVPFLLEGVLNFRILNVDGEHINAAIQLSNIKGSIQKPKGRSPILELYGKLFMVEFDTDGRMVGFTLPNSISEEEGEMLKGLMLPFEIIIPENQTQKWTATHEDSLGVYEAEYEQVQEKIQKTKKEYRQPAAAQKSEFSSKLIESTTTIEISPTCWLKNATGHEEIGFLINNMPFQNTKSNFSLQESHTPRDVTLAIWQNSLTAASLKMELKSQNKSQFSAKDEQTSAAYKEMFKEKNIDLNAIAKLLDTQNNWTNDELIKHYLLQNEAELKKISDYLAQRKFSDKAASRIIYLLAVVGNVAAQEELLEIASDSYNEMLNRERALVAFGSLKNPPAKKTLDILIDYSKQLATGFNELNLASTATLAIGAMSHTLSQTNSEASDGIRQTLSEMLIGSTDPLQKYYVALSLGNAYLDDFLPKELLDQASSMLNSGDEVLLKAGVTLLGQVKNQERGEILFQAKESLKNDAARELIYGAIANKELKSDQIESVAKEFRSEQNSAIRYHMIELIGTNKAKLPNVDALLKERLAKEETRKNFEKIVEIIEEK